MAFSVVTNIYRCEVMRSGSYTPRQPNDAQKRTCKFRDQVLNRDIELAETEINTEQPEQRIAQVADSPLPRQVHIKQNPACS